MRRKSLETTVCNLEEVPETALRLKAKYCEYATQIEILEVTSGIFRGQFIIEIWKL